MAFPKGKPNPNAGRKPGSPNKGTRDLQERMQAAVLERCGLADYDPVIELAIIANDKSNPVEVRGSAHKSVAPYIHAQRKAVEVTGAGGEPIEMKISLIDRIVSALEGPEEGEEE